MVDWLSVVDLTCPHSQYICWWRHQITGEYLRLRSKPRTDDEPWMPKGRYVHHIALQGIGSRNLGTRFISDLLQQWTKRLVIAGMRSFVRAMLALCDCQSIKFLQRSGRRDQHFSKLMCLFVSIQTRWLELRSPPEVLAPYSSIYYQNVA